MFERLALVILTAAIVTSGYYRRRARRTSETIARRREGGVLVVARLFMATLLFGPILVYAFAPERMMWASFAAPAWMRWTGVAVGLLLIPAVSWVLRSLGRNVSETVLTKRAHALVTFGPYRWIRHPLYTAGITLFLALGFADASWFILAVAALASVLLRAFVVPLEERALRAKFGDEYVRYTSLTGRFLPRL